MEIPKGNQTMDSGNRELRNVISKVLEIVILCQISAIGKDFDSNFIAALDHGSSCAQVK